jgi:hypothetical protein
MREIKANLEQRKEKIEQDIQLLRTWAAGMSLQGNLDNLIELISVGMLHIPYFSTTKGPVVATTEYGRAVIDAVKARRNEHVQ